MKILKKLKNQKHQQTTFYFLIKYGALILGLVASLGFYFQAYQIYLSQQTVNVSVASYLLWLIINFVFVVYGLMEAGKIITLTAVFNLFGCVLVLTMFLLY